MRLEAEREAALKQEAERKKVGGWVGGQALGTVCMSSSARFYTSVANQVLRTERPLG